MLRSSLVVLLVACGSSEPPPNTPESQAEPLESGPTRAAVENEEAEAEAEEAVDTDVPVLTLSVTVMELAAATRYDVISPEGFPGRAMDPVLHIGEARLTSYEHVGLTTLRFESEDVHAGHSGGRDISLHWGEDVYELERTSIDDRNGGQGTLAP